MHEAGVNECARIRNHSVSSSYFIHKTAVEGCEIRNFSCDVNKSMEKEKRKCKKRKKKKNEKRKKKNGITEHYVWSIDDVYDLTYDFGPHNISF